MNHRLIEERQPCPVARRNLLGRARWITIRQGIPLAAEERTCREIEPVEVMIATVPNDFAGQACRALSQVTPVMIFIPWADSGVGLIVASAGSSHGLVAIQNVAGSSALGALDAAADDLGGRIRLVFRDPLELGDDDLNPSVPIAGVNQAMRQASNARPLAAEEFDAAVKYIRTQLKQPPGLPLGMGFQGTGQMESLTVNVVG